MKSNFKIESVDRSQLNDFQVEDLPVKLPTTPTIIQVRELDKKYTHANSNSGKCTLDNCSHHPTHWLTRQNADYCQSDMVCHQHAKIWMQVKNLVSK